MKKLLLFIFLFIFGFLSLFGSDESKNVRETDTSKIGKLVAFPIAFYLPETKLGFGGAGAYTFRSWNQESYNNPSQVRFALTYTLEKQILAIIPFKLFLDDDDYYVFGEIGFYKYFYRYFGVGSNTLDTQQEDYRADFPRFKFNFLRSVGKKFYIGPSIWYDNYKIKDLDPGGELIGGVQGSAGGIITAVGIRSVFDRRDQIFYPTKGWYIDFLMLNSGDTWGSDYKFGRIELNATRYFSLDEKNMIALNFVKNIVTGDPPFYHMALYGGSRNARGYRKGRYRDFNTFVFNAEWRTIIKGRFGATVFASLGGLAPKISKYRLDEMKIAYGAGLRYALDKENHLNFRFDYGFGDAGSEFYITVGEAF